MIELDSDDELLRDNRGKVAKRDIVQFVKFLDYKNSGSDVLAEEVLREVPD